MKIFKTAFTVLALFVLLFTGMTCKKSYIEKNELPPITQTGANTFGCYVNGDVFVPRGSGANIVLSVEKNGNDYFVKAIHNEKGSIIFEFSPSLNNEIKCFSYSNYKNQCLYNVCPPLNYELKIDKHDTNSKIISGRFSYTFPATAACPEVKITEGRFDLKYTEN